MKKQKLIQGLFLWVGLFSAIALFFPKSASAEGCAERCGQGDRKSLFCHVPQGNPSNVQEICIADSSVAHHLDEHEGDHCGACEVTCEEITCCTDQSKEEAGDLLLQGGRLVLQDSDGSEGNLCCVPDTDGDGQCGGSDQCPNDPLKTAPGVCGCGVSDADSDGDGTPDCNDDCANDSGKVNPGICGCGTADTDSDSDSVPDCNDICPGTADVDTDHDGVLDCNDVCPSDANKTTAAGVCGCGVSEADSDGDGTPDCNDNCASDPAKTSPGICGCGTSDADVNSNGVADCNDVSGVLAGIPDTPPTTPSGGTPGKGAGVSFGGGFCQLVKADQTESLNFSLAWPLLFAATPTLLWALRRTRALRASSK